MTPGKLYRSNQRRRYVPAFGETIQNDKEVEDWVFVELSEICLCLYKLGYSKQNTKELSHLSAVGVSSVHEHQFKFKSYKNGKEISGAVFLSSKAEIFWVSHYEWKKFEELTKQ